jgi:hypothetical protein
MQAIGGPKGFDALVGFLYVLMRDELVPGRIEAIVAGHIEASREMNVQVVFSSPTLEQLAREYARRIVGIASSPTRPGVPTT